MVTCSILPVQCIVECKHRCKIGFAHEKISSASAKFENFHALYKNKPKLLVISFSHVAARLASANILPINIYRCILKYICMFTWVCADIMSVHIHVYVWMCFAYICLEAYSLAEASIVPPFWPITCNSGYLIIRYMTTWFVKVIFKLCY